MMVCTISCGRTVFLHSFAPFVRRKRTPPIFFLSFLVHPPRHYIFSLDRFWRLGCNTSKREPRRHVLESQRDRFVDSNDQVWLLASYRGHARARPRGKHGSRNDGNTRCHVGGGIRPNSVLRHVVHCLLGWRPRLAGSGQNDGVQVHTRCQQQTYVR